MNTWQPENPYRPFCSERCKLIDLGEWANESRTIPGDSADADFLSPKNQEGDDFEDR